MRIIISRNEIDRLRIEYESAKAANFEDEEELLFSFRESGFIRLTMRQAKELIDNADLSWSQQFFTINLELNHYGN